MAYRLVLSDGLPYFQFRYFTPHCSRPSWETQTTPTRPNYRNAHPIIAPYSVEGYRIVSVKRKKVEQVLVNWEELPAEEKTWERLSTIAHLDPKSNLEDKVRSAEVGDVSIVLNHGQVFYPTQAGSGIERLMGFECRGGENPNPCDQHGNDHPRDNSNSHTSYNKMIVINNINGILFYNLALSKRITGWQRHPSFQSIQFNNLSSDQKNSSFHLRPQLGNSFFFSGELILISTRMLHYTDKLIQYSHNTIGFESTRIFFLSQLVENLSSLTYKSHLFRFNLRFHEKKPYAFFEPTFRSFIYPNPNPKL